MHLKFLFVVVLLGTQLSQISASPIENKSLIDDIIEKVNEAYETMKALIDVKIQEAINNLEQIRNKIMQDGYEVIQAVKREIQIMINNAKQSIEEIKQQAEDLGKDISHCVADNDDRFDALYKELLLKEAECVQTETDSAMDIINEAVMVLSKAIQIISNIPNRIKQCKTIECFKGIIADIKEIENELPEQIIKTVEQVEEFVETFKERIAICSLKELSEATIRVAGIVNDVAKCAAGRNRGIVCPV